MTFLSRLSLANRGLVALAAIAILVIGALVIPTLKQDLYPSLDFPAVTVITSYPGASPSVVEQDVTNPLEQSLQGMQNVQQITSYSSAGASEIIIEYNYGTSISQVSQLVSRQVSSVQANLPSGVTPQVQTFSINDQPIIQLAVTSNEDQATLAVDLQNKIVPVLSGINGVAQVNVVGVRQQVVTIDLDLNKLQANGLSIIAVQGALQAGSVNLPAGQLTNDGKTFSIVTSNTFNSLSDLQNLIVGTKTNPACQQAYTPACNAPGTPIKLSDVATVQQTLAPSTSLARVNGQPSLGISMTKNSDGNIVSISQSVNSDISELQNQLGHGAKITVVSDQGPSISSAVNGLVNEGLIGAGFAILVILLFLFSIRSTLVTGVSIPLSVVIALIALWAGNLTLNLFTLGGLTIAIGRVVDDSIVVLENIYRHLKRGEEKRIAIPTAVREVAGAVTASTLTTVAVFLPIAFTGGIVGQVFSSFAITVTAALLASLLVALTVIPVLAFWFLKSPKAAATQTLDEKPTFLERGYTPVVRWVTGHKVITLIVTIALFVGSMTLIPNLGTNFFSSSQSNTYSISQTLPVGTSLEVTNEAAQQVEQVLGGMSQIQHYQVTVGSASFGGSGGATNSASFSITVDPNADQTAFQNTLQSRLNGLTDVGTVQLSTSSGSGFSSSDIAVDIQASNQANLAQATQQVLGAFSKVPHLTNVNSSLTPASPLINVTVDPKKANAHGLTPAEVGLLLREIYTGMTVMNVTFNGQQEQVNLQLGTPVNTVAAMQNLLLPTPIGSVKLGDVATVTQTLGPTEITHIGGQRTAMVSATATTNDTGTVANNVQQQINLLHLPAGVTVTIGGVGQSQTQAFSSLGLALLIAVLLVYLVMVATFRSLVQPLILLVSLPFAASGSVVMLLLTHTQLGVPALIGLLIAVGIVVTNAIVLLDLIHQCRVKGLDARAAVIEGASHRVRPILMTAVATILALIPMALGLSKDSIFIGTPLAITVIGGLASSTVLTLLLVPALYMMIEGRKDRKNLAKPKVVEAQETSKQEVLQGV